MIERIYLDNIRSFVNFEWRPGPLAVILGNNGTGKTALFSTLDAIQRFVAGDVSTEEAFPGESRTRWDTRQEQTVELDLRTPQGLCKYRLVVEHDARGAGGGRVKEEHLRVDGRPVVDFTLGELQLYNDDGPAGPRLSTRSTRSAVGAVIGGVHSALPAFQEGMGKLWLLRPDPRSMVARIKADSHLDVSWLRADLSNFAGWYLQTLPKKPGTMFKALQDLGTVLEGLVELYDAAGLLHVRFEKDGQTHSFRFDELSDGQRALIALYVLRHVAASPGALLAIDEPDNYVALAEIQPWLLQIERAALKSGGPQVWLISHHPEVLNLLAVEHGWRFFRDGLGPTRVERFKPAAGLDAAETVARGWEGEPNG
jgi:predicted ATPase